MRPLVAAALRSRLSALGIALTTASAFLFLALLGLELLGYLQNPYAGIVVFIMVPALFVFGLLLIPIGLWLELRRGTRPGYGSLMLDFGAGGGYKQHYSTDSYLEVDVLLARRRLYPLTIVQLHRAWRVISGLGARAARAAGRRSRETSP